ncbi:MAG: cell division protein FtsL [Azoarcus sp.]|jgi:cell division protein FtsL|nr:cell division protein FtsL [Azoarcus sp.]
MIRLDTVFVTVLVVLLTASALGIVASQHHARKLHIALEHEQGRSRSLEVEQGQFEAEESSLAEHGQIEQRAREQLKMLSPRSGQIIVLKGRS